MFEFELELEFKLEFEFEFKFELEFELQKRDLSPFSNSMQDLFRQVPDIVNYTIHFLIHWYGEWLTNTHVNWGGATTDQQGTCIRPFHDDLSWI